MSRVYAHRLPWAFVCDKCGNVEIFELEGHCGLSWACPRCGGDLYRDFAMSVEIQRERAKEKS